MRPHAEADEEAADGVGGDAAGGRGRVLALPVGAEGQTEYDRHHNHTDAIVAEVDVPEADGERQASEQGDCAAVASQHNAQ